MQKFNRVHNESVEVLGHRFIAVKKEENAGIVFTASPLMLEESFNIMIVDEQDDSKGKEFRPSLFLGVTQQSPSPLSDVANLMPDDLMYTWILHTLDGTIRTHGVSGHSEQWTAEFGVYRPLAVGDVVSLTLHHNRSLSIKINEKSVTVFTGLPNKPLYGIIQMNVRQIEIVQTGETDEVFAINSTSENEIIPSESRNVKIGIPTNTFQENTNLTVKLHETSDLPVTFKQSEQLGSLKKSSPVVEISSDHPSEKPVIVDLPLKSMEDQNNDKPELANIRSLKCQTNGKWEVEGEVVGLIDQETVKVKINIPGDEMKLLVMETKESLDTARNQTLAEDIARAAERFDVTFVMAQRPEDPWNTLVQCCLIEEWTKVLDKMKKERGYTLIPDAERTKKFRLRDKQVIQISFSEDSNIIFGGDKIRNVVFDKEGGDPDNLPLKKRTNQSIADRHGYLTVSYTDGEEQKTVSLVITVPKREQPENQVQPAAYWGNDRDRLMDLALDLRINDALVLKWERISRRLGFTTLDIEDLKQGALISLIPRMMEMWIERKGFSASVAEFRTILEREHIQSAVDIIDFQYPN